MRKGIAITQLFTYKAHEMLQCYQDHQHDNNHTQTSLKLRKEDTQ